MSTTDKDIQGNANISRNLNVGGHTKINGDITVGHNVFVKGWVDAPNIKGPLKGLYATVDALTAAYPSPKPGWYALVGDTLPAAIYRVDGGQWVATGETGGEFNLWMDHYETEIKSLGEDIIKEAEAREQADNSLGEDIAKEAEAREQADKSLGEDIAKEAEAREQADNSLGEDIAKEAEAREQADKSLGEDIAKEAEAREQADKSLGEDIAKEAEAREQADKSLGEDIAKEAEAREQADKSLGEDIAKEAEAREQADKSLGEDIAKEAEAREQADKSLGDYIANLNWNLGFTNFHDFNENEYYSKDDFVFYQGELFRFKVPHNGGPWNLLEVSRATLLDFYIVQEQGDDPARIMSQNAVTTELNQISLAKIDDIINTAVLEDGIYMYDDYEVVYVEDKKIFAVRGQNGKYYTFWRGCDKYIDKAGTAILRDKLYLLGNQIYVWDDELQTLVLSNNKWIQDIQDELYAMGLDYEAVEDGAEGYIEVKLTGKDDGIVGGSTEIPFASSEQSGFMSKADKVKLEEIESGATKTEVTQESGDSATLVMSQAAVTQADKSLGEDIAKEAEAREQADLELLDRMQGRSSSSNPYRDPFKFVSFTGSDYLKQFNTWLDDLHTTTPEPDYQKTGFFRVSLWGTLCEVKNLIINWEAMRFRQIILGTFAISGQGKVGISKRYTTLQREYNGSEWSKWEETDFSEIESAIADSLRTDYSGDSVQLSLCRGNSELFKNSISAATQDKAGVMSAADKKKLDGMKDTIVFTGATVDAATETLILNKVSDETLVLDEVIGGSVSCGVTKVSQLENDKGYLSGTIKQDSIILNND